MPPGALILKGGGVKGLAFAGVVQELEKNGHHFEVFIGTSAGAIAAVLLAAGFTGKDLEDALVQLDFSEFRDTSSFKAWLFNLPFHWWLYPGWRLTQWMHDRLKDKLGKSRLTIDPVKLCDLPRRAVVFATGPNGGVVVFDSHADNRDAEAAYAVRCSASIPIFFRPGSLNDHRVLDGGLLNNYPVEAFQTYEHGRGVVTQPEFIAVYLATQTGGLHKKRSIIRDILDIYLNRDDRLVVKQYYDRTIIVDPSPIRTTHFSISDCEKRLLLLRGRLAAIEFLAARAESEAVAAKAKSDTDPTMGLLAWIQKRKASELKSQARNLKPELSQIEVQVQRGRKTRRKRMLLILVLVTIGLTLLLTLALAGT